MTSYRTIEEVENALAPDLVNKYPVVLRRRVTQEESDTINEWVNKKHGCYDMTGEEYEKQCQK